MNFDENRVKTVKVQQYSPYNKEMECADSSRYRVKGELSHGRVIDSKRARPLPASCHPLSALRISNRYGGHCLIVARKTHYTYVRPAVDT